MLMRTRKHLLIITLIAFVPLAVSQTRPIDSSSRLVVHAYKSGLFSGFADNHEIEAPISEGTVDEHGLRVRFVVDASRMKVLDPKLSADKRREIQDRMEGPEVLILRASRKSLLNPPRLSVRKGRCGLKDSSHFTA